MDRRSLNSLISKFPEYTNLRLGLNCNANCYFCNVPIELNREPVKARYSTQAVKNMILGLVKKGCRYIEISGGEPTIRKDLPTIINFAVKNGIREMELQTNCILLDNLKLVKSLKNSGLKRAFVGLHSHLPNVHDHLLRKKGAFKRSVKGISNLLDSGIDVTLNPVLTSKNYSGLEKYFYFVTKSFPLIKKISLSVIQPHGRAWGNSYLIPRYKTISPVVEDALNAYMGRFNIFNPYCGLPLCIGGWHKYLNNCSEFISSFSNKKSVDNNKIKLFNCKYCDLDNYCKGVWKNYILIHPELGDMIPITGRKN